MTDKQNLLTQLTAAITSLNLETEDTGRLLFFLKTAIKSGVNTDSIITELASRIGAATTTDSVKELVALTSAINFISLDRTIAVSELADLNALTYVSAGSIYYVESESAPYIKKSDGTWVLIDPKFAPVEIAKLWAWGANGSGRLGDASTTSRLSPVSVVGGFTDWVQISAGGYHTAAVRANGTAWAWGSNGFGRLGDDSTTARSSPVSVVGGFTDWVQISAGRIHTAAVRANGTAWAWGNNGEGRLGDDSTTARSSPVSVVGDFTDWVQISAGDAHTAAVRANGTAWAWGSNGSGRLGDNSTTSRLSPVSVVGDFTDWVQISAGDAHTAAVRANGTAWAWGNNNQGRLGDDSTTARSSPVSVVGSFTDWVQISAGRIHTAAVRANGTAWAWGSNGYGRLGDDSTTARSSPVSVVGSFTDWVQISAGGASFGGHTAAVRANGTAWAWGFNGNGRLGDNSTTARSSPVSVVGDYTDWVQISAGGAHTAGVRTG